MTGLAAEVTFEVAMANHQSTSVLQPSMGCGTITHQTQAQMQGLDPTAERFAVGVGLLLGE